MASTYQRSLLKGVLWEFFSFLIASLAVYFFYGDIKASIKFSLILTLIKIPLFFIHERAWKRVSWGKVK